MLNHLRADHTCHRQMNGKNIPVIPLLNFRHLMSLVTSSDITCVGVVVASKHAYFSCFHSMKKFHAKNSIFLHGMETDKCTFGGGPIR